MMLITFLLLVPLAMLTVCYWASARRTWRSRQILIDAIASRSFATFPAGGPGYAEVARCALRLALDAPPRTPALPRALRPLDEATMLPCGGPSDLLGALLATLDVCRSAPHVAAAPRMDLIDASLTIANALGPARGKPLVEACKNACDEDLNLRAGWVQPGFAFDTNQQVRVSGDPNGATITVVHSLACTHPTCTKKAKVETDAGVAPRTVPAPTPADRLRSVASWAFGRPADRRAPVWLLAAAILPLALALTTSESRRRELARLREVSEVTQRSLEAARAGLSVARADVAQRAERVGELQAKLEAEKQFARDLLAPMINALSFEAERDTDAAKALEDAVKVLRSTAPEDQKKIARVAVFVGDAAHFFLDGLRHGLTPAEFKQVVARSDKGEWLNTRPIRLTSTAEYTPSDPKELEGFDAALLEALNKALPGAGSPAALENKDGKLRLIFRDILATDVSIRALDDIIRKGKVGPKDDLLVSEAAGSALRKLQTSALSRAREPWSIFGALLQPRGPQSADGETEAVLPAPLVSEPPTSTAGEKVESAAPTAAAPSPASDLPAEVESARQAALQSVAQLVAAAEKAGLVESNVEPPPVLDILVTGRATDKTEVEAVKGSDKPVGLLSPEAFGAYFTGHAAVDGIAPQTNVRIRQPSQGLKLFYDKRAADLKPLLDVERKKLQEPPASP